MKTTKQKRKTVKLVLTKTMCGYHYETRKGQCICSACVDSWIDANPKKIRVLVTNLPARRFRRVTLNGYGAKVRIGRVVWRGTIQQYFELTKLFPYAKAVWVKLETVK